MQRSVETATEDVDVILYVLDAHAGISDADKNLVYKFAGAGKPFVLALSKTDIMPENLLIAELKEFADADFPIVPVSARKGRNVKELLAVVQDKLADGERIFEEDVISDRSERFMIAEIMREKILLKCEKEIPHGVAVIVNKFGLREDKSVYEIDIDIICEKLNHKAIIIGKNGGMIKEISSFARKDMEKFLGKKVYLTTYVKVKEDWRNSAFLMKEYGYGEEKR